MKPEIKKTIAAKYGISRKTLNVWLKELNIKPVGNYIKGGDIELLYSEFGNPENSVK